MHHEVGRCEAQTEFLFRERLGELRVEGFKYLLDAHVLALRLGRRRVEPGDIEQGAKKILDT